jgi:Mrp family chromosome partitioning ATPase
MPPPVREAFRTLQIQLDLQPKDGCRRILVTSASSGDGKTTAVLNLAFALVSAGHRVVLVDFDLRKPDLGRQLGVTGTVPLDATVAGGGPLTSIMRSVPRLPPLRLVDVATGPGDLALLPLLTTRTRAMLQDVDDVADYVLLDTAPVGEVGDALPLLGDVDDVLVVGRPGSTDDRALGAMAGYLRRAAVAPTGWIVTGVDAALSPYYDADPRRRSGAVWRTARRIVQGSG